MADPAAFYGALQEITGSLLARNPPSDSAIADEAAANVSPVARQIMTAASEFAAARTLAALAGGEKVFPASDDSIWLGHIAGLALAEKLRDRGLGLQDFFKTYARVKARIIDGICRTISAPDQFRPGLVSLDAFFSGLAAGFAQEWLRAVKANFRRRQQEAKLYILRENKRYASVFYRMSEPAFVVDHGLRLIDVNPACEEFFRAARAELIGMSCCELIGEKLCENSPLAEILTTGGSFSNVEGLVSGSATEGSGLDKDKFILMAGTAAGDLSDGHRGGVVIFQDITERKKNEEELDKYRNWLEDLVDERTEELLAANARLQREIGERRYIEKELIQATASLKRSNAELEQFAHVASHDLQEPLMLVSSFAERLMARYGAAFDARGRDYLGRITKGTRKLQNLVAALLQLSKVATSSASFERLNMNELVRDVIGDLEEIISRSGARIDLESLHDLHGDAVQIRQLFQNLISNALKYRREEERPSVSIGSRVIDDICEISVADNGIGLAPGDLEKIFEPLVRLHGRDIFEGTGLGLTTCKKIVQRHGGEILAHAGPQCGSVFIVRLPRRRQSGSPT